MNRNPHQLLRIEDVMERVTLRKTAIYNRIREGTFPKPRDLGGRTVRWLAQDIDNWIESLPTTGDQETDPSE